VKRLLYKNPDAEFVFCAGDDKVRFCNRDPSTFKHLTSIFFPSSKFTTTPLFQTDEDMFRALILFPPGATKAIMDPPLSVTLIDKDPSPLQPVELAIAPEAVFTTTVGHNTKRTLASWHVTSPAEVIDHMLSLVGLDRDNVTAARKKTMGIETPEKKNSV
jgi:trehalose 6-phosphate synthase/phosphatase